MSQLSITFLMEPLEAVNPAKNTTYRMLVEAAARGHTLYHTMPEKLSLTPGKVTAHARPITLLPDAQPFYRLGDAEMLDLATQNLVMMRQDPPFDMAYLSATYMLEQLPQGTWVMNSPQDVRNHPEKLFPLRYPDLIPPTLISRDSHAINAFIAEHRDVVLKPLYAFGGQGVFKLSVGDSNIAPVLELLLGQSTDPIIAQRFIPAVTEGDTRILLMDGEVMGAFRRVPAKGQHRANLAVGGALEAVELSSRQLHICEALAPALKAKKLFFTGIDVIGDYLTEINVTSPMGFAQLDALDGGNSAARFWDAAEIYYKTHYAEHGR